MSEDKPEYNAGNTTKSFKDEKTTDLIKSIHHLSHDGSRPFSLRMDTIGEISDELVQRLESTERTYVFIHITPKIRKYLDLIKEEYYLVNGEMSDCELIELAVGVAARLCDGYIETCEGCGKPATTTDSDNVPLYDACYEEI